MIFIGIKQYRDIDAKWSHNCVLLESVYFGKFGNLVLACVEKT